LELRHLPAHRRAAVRPRARVVRDLPVSLGLERPADGADLRLRPKQAADDRADHLPPLHLRSAVRTPQCGRVPADGRATGRVLLVAALLRAGPPRGLSQDLSVFLVPHTHWDREWYRPFQSFRISLVDVVDDVLDRLEAEPGLRFTLDGQLATVDDYLEIRPEAEVRIRKLVGEGRLAIGPWQTLMDEFLVDGETTLRNLEAGMRRAENFGSAMRIGYLPDMFGHVAQMPQILRLSGIETAVVWRGVPSAVDFHRFVWEAPDGSTIVTEYLPAGYSNAAYILDVPGPVDLGPFEERFAPWFRGDSVLGMVGTDHMPLPRDFKKRIPDHATVGTLADYLADASSEGLSRWRGD